MKPCEGGDKEADYMGKRVVKGKAIEWDQILGMRKTTTVLKAGSDVLRKKDKDKVYVDLYYPQAAD